MTRGMSELHDLFLVRDVRESARLGVQLLSDQMTPNLCLLRMRINSLCVIHSLALFDFVF